MKKVLAVVVSMMLGVGCLSGCSLMEKVTAESLLSQPFGEEEYESLEMNASVDMAFDMDLSGMMGEDSGSSKMNASITADVDIQSTKEAVHMKGKANVNVFGFSQEREIETYSDVKNGTSYEYNTEYGQWVKSVADSGKSTDYSKLFDISGIVKDPVLEKYEKGDEVYTVKGTVDLSDFKDVVSGDLLEESAGSIDLSGAVVDITMGFDKDSKLLENVKLVVDTGSFDSGDSGVQFTKFEVEIAVKGIDGVEVSIPSDVIEGAVEEDALVDFGDYVDYGVDGFGTEEGATVTLGDGTVATYPFVDGEMPVEVEEGVEGGSEEASEVDISNEKMSTYIYGVDDLTMEDLESVLSSFYSKDLDYDVKISLLSFANRYTVSEFISSLQYYDSLQDASKVALAFMSDLGVVEDSVFEDAGISVDEVHTLVEEYVEPCR